MTKCIESQLILITVTQSAIFRCLLGELEAVQVATVKLEEPEAVQVGAVKSEERFEVANLYNKVSKKFFC